MLKIQVISSLSLMALLVGCATPTAAEKQVQQNVSEQKSIESTAQAAGSGRFAIHQSTKLTEDQKIRLLALMDRAELNIADIRKKEGQLKAALFQELAEGHYDRKEIAVYKSKLKKLEAEKMDLMFSNLEESRKILGPTQPHDLDQEMLEFYRAGMER
jgi:Spy/CpxP family protein refolding chaperone